MAGCTMEEAQTAQHAASGKPPLTIATTATQVAKSGMANLAATTLATTTLSPTLSPNQTFNIEGISYVLTPTTPLAAPVPHSGNLCVSIGEPIQLTDLNNFEACITTSGNLGTSLDWSEHSQPITLANSLSPPVGTTAHACPFILDSRATCHISPVHSDFSDLQLISDHPITGLGGTRVYATGIGTVELKVDSGHTLILHNVLFVPASTVCLISVVAMNREQHYFTIFDPDDCWLTNIDGSVIAHGTVSSTRNLYTLMTDAPGDLPPVLGNQSAFPIFPYVSFISTNTPDVETWHRHL